MSDQPTISLKSLRKKKVVDTSTAETIGRVKDVRIDAAASRLTGLVVKGGAVKNGHIAVGDVISFGHDAITVASADVLVEDPEEYPAASDAYGTRLLDDGGTHLGKVSDLTMDERGHIVGVTAGKESRPQRLKGIGSYAVVIARG